MRLRRREAAAGQEQRARRGDADLGDDERADHRRQDAEAHFGEAEHGVVGGDDDVADRGQAGPAAERRALDPSDQRHRQRVERAEQRRGGVGVAEVVVARSSRACAASRRGRRRR